MNQDAQLKNLHAGNIMPVILSGVVVPWIDDPRNGRDSDYKLVCASGTEYFMVTDPERRSLLSYFSWEEVKVKGLLNPANMTLIPQNIFPKGPAGERKGFIDPVSWGRCDLTHVG